MSALPRAHLGPARVSSIPRMGKVIPANWDGLPEAIRARFGHQAGRQRTMFHEGHLVLVTHQVPGPDEAERRAALFWRQPSGTWKSTGLKGGLNGLRELVDTYRRKVLELESTAEKAKRASDYFSVLNEVAPILRSARHLHGTLQEAREALPKDPDLIALRDLAQDVERMAELAQTDAKAGLDFTIAKRSEDQAELSEHIARSSHRLNLIAALFLPVSAIGSVFGVNLAHGLEEAGKPWIFWSFVIVAFLIGFLVRASINKKENRA